LAKRGILDPRFASRRSEQAGRLAPSASAQSLANCHRPRSAPRRTACPTEQAV